MRSILLMARSFLRSSSSRTNGVRRLPKYDSMRGIITDIVR